MANLSSFLKFTDDEVVMEEWEVLDDPGTFRLTDVLLFAFLGAISWYTFRVILPQYMPFPIMDVLFTYVRPLAAAAFTSTWAPLALALALTVWVIMNRPAIHGYVSLTNWRFIYYERGTGRFKRSHHRVVSANLEDIVGIHSNYNHGFLGRKTLLFNVHTKYEGGVILRVGDRGGLLTKIPGIGKWVGRNTIGKDAFDVIPVIFKQVQAYRGQVAGSDVSY